jgi:hypothetical protein
VYLLLLNLLVTPNLAELIDSAGDEPGRGEQIANHRQLYLRGVNLYLR